MSHPSPLSALAGALTGTWALWRYRQHPASKGPATSAGPRGLLSLFGLGLGLALAFCALLFLGNNHARSAAPTSDRLAVPTTDFLDSIGVVSTFPDRGQPVERTITMVKSGGFRWVRAGIEGLTDDGPTNVGMFLRLHRETGARLSWGMGSGGFDLPRLLETGRMVARSGALLAFEGNNEPNNWPVRYQGETGGGLEHSWLPVAKLQRDLYLGVKRNPELARYPVWSISEPGAQTDNVGLQFLEIPKGTGTLMPEGTKFADFANVHNYVYHPHAPQPADNKVWDAADPSAASKVDGLYGNFGRTWRKWFRGYGGTELSELPRVTTETGTGITDQISEELHGLHLMTIYLAQFKRGYSHTSVYLLRDRTDEAGNQTFGFFRPDYSPRKAAIYLHNLTTILADNLRNSKPGQLDYAIGDQPGTVHDLLLQHSNGTFQLIVWGERLNGEDRVTVSFAQSHRTITIYDPTRGTTPISRIENAQRVDLSMSNHPFVIVVSPFDN